MARARLLKKSAKLSVRADGGARLAVVADTHSQPHPKTTSLLTALQPDAILHAGDIGDPKVLDTLESIAPLFAIRGNIDARGLPDVLTLDVVDKERALLRILIVHIAVNGPRLRADIVPLAHGERAQLVVCGHSHVPFIGRDRGLAVFNPGSIGPRRFLLPIVFGTIEVTPSGVRLAHVDCETGQAWSPPERV